MIQRKVGERFAEIKGESRKFMHIVKYTFFFFFFFFFWYSAVTTAGQ